MDFIDAFGQKMTTVRIETRTYGELVFPLGHNHGYRRVENAITLKCSVSCVLPFELEIDLNPDGSWQLRHCIAVAENMSGYNNYLHLAHDSEWDRQHRPAPTPEQSKAVAEWFHRP